MTKPRNFDDNSDVKPRRAAQAKTECWMADLPDRFRDLCVAQAFTTPEQGWILALALRESPDAFTIEPFEPEELATVLRTLAPSEARFGQVHFNGPMPITGALQPANAPMPSPTADPQPLSASRGTGAGHEKEAEHDD